MLLVSFFFFSANPGTQSASNDDVTASPDDVTTDSNDVTDDDVTTSAPTQSPDDTTDDSDDNQDNGEQVNECVCKKQHSNISIRQEYKLLKSA